MNSKVIAYRRYLTRLDENVKAYRFINAAAKLLGDEEVKKDAELAFKQVAHVLDPTLYKKFYNENISENPVPLEAIFEDVNFPDRLRWVKAQLKAQGAKTVLDLGCSEGSYALNIAKSGHKVTGVNLFTSSIKLANERAKQTGLPARFVQSDIMEYDEGKKFDAVMLFEVIEHVPDPEAMVDKMMSLCEKNGVCYISTPNGTADEYSSAMGVDMENAAGFEFKGHVRVYTEESLRDLVKKYEVINFYHSETDSMPLLHCAFRRKK